MAQLSDALNENVTSASQRPFSVEATMLAGQVIAGFSVSFTVTMKLHRLVLPLASVATHVTVVWPIPKVEPEGGVHTTTAFRQLSDASGANPIDRSQRPEAVLVTMFAGHANVGDSWSSTMM